MAQTGTVCAGTRTLITLDIAGNPEIGSSSSLRESESAITAFVESETAVADVAAGVLSTLKMDNCGLSENMVAKVAATIAKSKTKRGIRVAEE